METWRNWSGKITAEPSSIHHLRSEEDALALVARAGDEALTVRPVGSAHSHSPLVPTSDIIVDTSGLSGVVSAHPESERAWVWAGTTIYALGRSLHDAGLALPNQGDIDRQTIAGATATGTHGTGSTLTNLSAMVTGARIALAGGELALCSASENPRLWSAAQLNLGGLGIITQLELQLRRPFRLRQRGWSEAFDDMLPRLHEIIHQSRHFEFFWFPTADMVVAKAIDETDDPAEYPVAAEGSRCAWSHEVFPNHRTWPHTEMEYSVPIEQGPACLSAIRDLLRADFPAMGWPVEYRTVAADDVWLSTAYQRPTVTISMHVDVAEDDQDLFRACEEVFVDFEGRPHWGKAHFRSSDELARAHPRWSDWWGVRDAADPEDVFLNDYLRTLRGRP